eukprot:SAG31_NODE_210_length_20286_cov_22.684748_9_plen_366_part_00
MPRLCNSGRRRRRHARDGRPGAARLARSAARLAGRQLLDFHRGAPRCESAQSLSHPPPPPAAPPPPRPDPPPSSAPLFSPPRHPDLLERIESQARARRGNWSAAQSEAERQAARSSRGPENDTFFDEFRPQLEVEQWMQALAERNPALVRYIPTLGPSVESRPIPALAVGGTDDGPAIYFQATLHAREWITTSTTLYIAAAMAESDDPRLRALVAAVRFYIVPVANPDGYVYSWSGPINRMLRKNRAPDPLGVGGLCDGVDLNRNYGYQWNNGPLCSSAIQCLPTYHGSAPNSEPETRATSGFLDEIIAQHSVVLGAIDWHSYSQLILRPYGYSCAPFEVELPPNDAEHEAIGAAMAVRCSHPRA